MQIESILDFMREQAYRPMTFEELCDTFAASDETFDEAKRQTLKERIADLESQGLIVRTRTERFGVPQRMDLVVGTLEVKARGFGFVVEDEEGSPDMYIGASDMAGAMDGDRVIARPKKTFTGHSKEGEIIRIVRRARHTVVGQLRTFGGYGFVLPDDKHLNQEIFIPGEHLYHAVDGQKVVVEIKEFPDQTLHSATGIVKEVLGFPNDPGVDILAIVRKYGIPEVFPDTVLQAAEKVPHTVSEEELATRRDLRDEMIVTIDGADAKDLDDAVHSKKLDNGNYLLGVHIADVAYYVRENSILDQEAYKRGTSVYLVDRVIPMLPPRLSNGICSLHPQVDRLTLTCEMEWSPSMQLVRHEIYSSVIRSKERMTYADVRDILSGHDVVLNEKYHDLIDYFRLMEELAMKLRRRRMERGAVDFNFAETKVKVDESGQPIDIVRRDRSIAEMIIEEFMLAANETVAEHFYWLDAPFLYRVHESPTLERMTSLNEFVHNFGYHLKAAGNIHPKALQDLLDKVRGQREELVISYVMLRSMKQARYSAESLGHFGLSAKYYTHFTSPIRRYPDLMVHRVIREMLIEAKFNEERKAHLHAVMPDVATHSSERERNAVDAERETDLIKKIEWMMDKVGQEFEGMISGVTGFGLFVQLDNSVEGLVHVSYLSDDYYHYYENLHALIGERLKHTYRIGDRVRVRVLTASKEQLGIDLGMVEKLEEDDVAFSNQVTAKDGDRRSRKKDFRTDTRRDGSRSTRPKRLNDHRKPRRSSSQGEGSSTSASRGRDEGVPAHSTRGKKRRAPSKSASTFVESGTRAGESRSGERREEARMAQTRVGEARRDRAGQVALTGDRRERSRRAQDYDRRRSQGSNEVGQDGLTGQRQNADPSSDASSMALRSKKTSLLKNKGGYADGAALSQGNREQRKRDKKVLQEIEQTYGIPVKDKAKRHRKSNETTQKLT